MTQQALNDAVAELLLRSVTGKQLYLTGDKQYGLKELPHSPRPYVNRTGLCQSSHFSNLLKKYTPEMAKLGEEFKVESLSKLEKTA